MSISALNGWPQYQIRSLDVDKEVSENANKNKITTDEVILVLLCLHPIGRLLVFASLLTGCGPTEPQQTSSSTTSSGGTSSTASSSGNSWADIKIVQYQNGCMYHGADIGPVTTNNIINFQNIYGGGNFNIAVTHSYLTNGGKFPDSEARVMASMGGAVYIQIIPATNSLSNIINGSYDSALSNFSAGVKSFGGPVFVAFGPGANVDTSIDPSLYTNTYRYAQKKIKGFGATNITWAWEIYVNRDLSTDYSYLPSYYPGSDYVDWIAVKAYNTTYWGSPLLVSYAPMMPQSLMDNLISYKKPLIGAFTSDAKTAYEDANGKAPFIYSAIDNICSSGNFSAMLYDNFNEDYGGVTQHWAITSTETTNAYSNAINLYRSLFTNTIKTIYTNITSSSSYSSSSASSSTSSSTSSSVSSGSSSSSSSSVGSIPLNSTLWEKANWANGGLFNCGFQLDHVAISNGDVYITLDNQSSFGYPYTSGEYRTTNGSYGYGYYEVLMKPSTGWGVMTGSFFVYTGSPWDEIDIEFSGTNTTQVQFNYFTSGAGNHEYTYNLGYQATNAIHKYAFEWNTNYITWYVDDTAVHTATLNIPSHPGKIMLNIWTGDSTQTWLGGVLTNYQGPYVGQYNSVGFNPL